MEREAYRYSTLDTSEHYIRLVRISPDAEGDGASVQLDIAAFPMRSVAGQYHALSYTWGPVSPTCRIWLNGRWKDVRQNVARFLRFASRPQSFLRAGLFWIDSISINQECPEEKNDQVSRMGEVYRNASQVVIWLGEISESTVLEHSSLGESVLRELARISPYGEGPNIWRTKEPFWLTSQVLVQELRPIVDYLVRMLHHEYWDRLWIIQEICLSQSAWVISGSRKIFWENLISVHPWLRDLMELKPGLSDMEICPAFNWRSTFKRTNILSSFTEANRLCTDQPLEGPTDGRRFRNLAHLISMFSSHLCENPRDRIFGLLALSRETRVPIDYMQPPESLLLTMLELQDRLQHVNRLAPVLTDLMKALKVTSASFRDFIDAKLDGICHARYQTRIATLFYLEECDEATYHSADRYVAYHLQHESNASPMFLRENPRADFDVEGYVLAALSCLRPIKDEPRHYPYLLLYITKESKMEARYLVMKFGDSKQQRSLHIEPINDQMRSNIELQINALHSEDEFVLRSPPSPQQPQGTQPPSLPLVLPVDCAMHIVEQ